MDSIASLSAVSPESRKPSALFVMGVGGSGKSTLCEAFVREELQRSNSWCIVDKDVVSAVFAPELLRCNGLDPQDRDSEAYMQLCRNLEYATCLRVAAHQLELGCSVVLPGPWTRELLSGAIFSAEMLGLPACNLRHAFMQVPPDVLRGHIVQRNLPRDAWKLANWDEYAERSDRMLKLAQLKKLPVIDSKMPLALQLGRLREIAA